MSTVTEICQAAKAAAPALAASSGAQRNEALLKMATALEEHRADILHANEQDMNAARAGGTKESLLDRLLLTEERIVGIADALRNLAEQPDPLGEVVEGRELYNGIQMKRVRVPLGVVAMIYEARPNVTADTAGLCIKTGNACVLRGGSLAINSCLALADCLKAAVAKAGLPADAVQIIRTTERTATTELMEATGLVDVLIPRGGRALIQNCVRNAKVPVIETGEGNCHVYLHRTADMNKAVPIILNAKTQRPGVCNAVESLLVDECAADELVAPVLVALARAGVKIHADEHVARIAADMSLPVEAATEADWGTEYLELEISIKCVSGLDEAIAHINRYGTGHSECIVAQDVDAVLRFTNEVDAAAVYANASTRFTDGGEFGLGAEIGISTQKLHARGPMGLRELTSTKFVLMGSGQIRE